MGWHRKIYSYWDMGWINPPDIGWRQKGNDGSGSNLVVGDLQPGVAGGVALYMDGGNEWCTIGTIDITSWTQMTIGCWCKWTIHFNSRVMFTVNFDTSLNQGIRFQRTALNKVGFYVTSDAGAFAVNSVTQNLNDDSWHFLLGSFDGSTLNYYIDGEYEGTQAGASFNFAGASGETTIGSRGGANLEAEGRYDSVFLADGAFTRLEANDIYQRMKRGHL